MSSINLDLGAYELGQKSAQSFLLAGERFLMANMNRPETDEKRFETFFESLLGEDQRIVKSYFQRQVNLSLPQRIKVLGGFTDLQIEDKLTLETTAQMFATDALKASDLNLTYLQLRKFKGKEESAIIKKNKNITFNIHSLKVSRAQDRERIWSKKKVRLTDEASLAILAINERGDVITESHSLGQIKEGDTKKFNKKALLTVPVIEGKASFPYYFQVIAIERDSNKQWNKWISKIAAIAKSKITEELLKIGLSVVSLGLIPPKIAKIVASFVKGFIAKMINWIANLVRDKDDILGNATICYRIADFSNTNTGLIKKTFVEQNGKGIWKLAFSIDRS